MLNPEFQWLDPEPEHLERLVRLAGAGPAAPLPWTYALLTQAPQTRERFLDKLQARLAVPGDHPMSQVHAAALAVAREMEISLPEPKLFGFPESILASLLARVTQPSVLMLGVAEGETLAVGCLAGISRGGLDFFTTLHFLWADEPELAALQSLADFPNLCQAASRRFSRPAGGLFIQQDEFARWSQTRWAQGYLDQCLARGSAVLRWP